MCAENGYVAKVIWAGLVWFGFLHVCFVFWSLRQKEAVEEKFAGCIIHKKPFCCEILKSLSSAKTSKQFCTGFTVLIQSN